MAKVPSSWNILNALVLTNVLESNPLRFHVPKCQKRVQKHYQKCLHLITTKDLYGYCSNVVYIDYAIFILENIISQYEFLNWIPLSVLHFVLLRHLFQNRQFPNGPQSLPSVPWMRRLLSTHRGSVNTNVEICSTANIKLPNCRFSTAWAAHPRQ